MSLLTKRCHQNLSPSPREPLLICAHLRNLRFLSSLCLLMILISVYPCSSVVLPDLRNLRFQHFSRFLNFKCRFRF